ncbi:MAG: formylglycine-generating enzyme family protein [Verrucomicrobiota bacterium]
MIRNLLILATSVLLLAACQESSDEVSARPTPPPPDSTEGMVLIPGGKFMRGGDAGEMDGDSHSHQTAYPIHKVQVDAFWIDEDEVTNREFADFAAATGYVTFAEKPLPPARVRELEEAAQINLMRMSQQAAQATGEEREALLASIKRVQEASKDLHMAGSIVFAIPEGKLHDPQDITQWWKIVPGATWRTPGGPGTTWKERLDHPVVNVTYEDALAYANWVGKRLPTEAEWEKAARGGLDRQPYSWGSEMFPLGEDVWMANIWQGEWPHANTEADGYFTTSPVKKFPPNPYGLYDIAGNVWEIVSDLYHPKAYTFESATEPNPTGPHPSVVYQPGQPVTYRVTRGGSFLCSDVWCKGYQPGARQPFDNESPANHTGFRCVRDAKPGEVGEL